MKTKPDRFYLSMIPGLRPLISAKLHGLKVTQLGPVSAELQKVLQAEWSLLKSQVSEDRELMLKIRAANDSLGATQRAWSELASWSSR